MGIQGGREDAGGATGGYSLVIAIGGRGEHNARGPPGLGARIFVLQVESSAGKGNERAPTL
jgi:hypothetical protein